MCHSRLQGHQPSTSTAFGGYVFRQALGADLGWQMVPSLSMTNSDLSRFL